jgi:large subunit ribosomal protein L25
MAELLNVELRDTRGTRHTRRHRRAGRLPAVLYGHGQPCLSLLVSAEQMEAAIRHGARLVKLTGAVEEQAFVRELQWDTWGKHILHVDFSRVSEHERVRVRVKVEVRGEAPGMKAGGVVRHLIHELEIECEATSIPDRLHLSINQLNIGDKITVGQLQLPPGVLVLGDPEAVVVECVEPIVVEEAEPTEAAEAEPEVIGRKEEEEAEEEE